MGFDVFGPFLSQTGSTIKDMSWTLSFTSLSSVLLCFITNLNSNLNHDSPRFVFMMLWIELFELHFNATPLQSINSYVCIVLNRSSRTLYFVVLNTILYPWQRTHRIVNFWGNMCKPANQFNGETAWELGPKPFHSEKKPVPNRNMCMYTSQPVLGWWLHRICEEAMMIYEFKRVQKRVKQIFEIPHEAHIVTFDVPKPHCKIKID